jgi:guanyl-specific ribonuclease Sa
MFGADLHLSPLSNDWTRVEPGQLACGSLCVGDLPPELDEQLRRSGSVGQLPVLGPDRSSASSGCQQARAPALLLPPDARTHVSSVRDSDPKPHHRQGFVLTISNEALKARFLNQLREFTCKGLRVSQVANCVFDGQLCSDAGSCVENGCVCQSGREGQYCESLVGSSSDTTLPIVLGAFTSWPSSSGPYNGLLTMCGQAW